MLRQEHNWHIGETSAPLPPLVKGLPLIGNVLDINNRLPHFLAESYQKYGSIFRLKILNRPITFIGGLTANLFTARHEYEVFTSEFTFAGLTKEFGPFLGSDPPEEHRHLKSVLKNSYSQKLAIDCMPDLIRVVDDFIDSLNTGNSFELYSTVQELGTVQLGIAMLNYSCSEYVQDLRIFGSNTMNVYMFNTHLPLILKSNRFKKAKDRSYELAHKTLDYIKQTVPGKDRPSNIIDHLMLSKDIDGKPFTDEFLISKIIRTYMGAMSATAGLISMVFYNIYQNKNLQDRIFQEVTNVFERGVPTFKELRKLKVLHRATMETMRLYPMATILQRYTTKAFEFNNYRVDPKTSVYIGSTIHHYLPEYYPNPWEFNIDRDYGKSQRLKQYGLGDYACLGQRISDVIVMVTIAVLIRRGKFTIEPANYKVDPKKAHAAKIRDSNMKLKLIKKYD